MRRTVFRSAGFVLALALSLIGGIAAAVPARTGADSAASARSHHRIRHVFVIVLENKGYSTTFGAHSPAPYLAHTLPRRGQLLPDYYGVGHESLDNYVAMVSGEGPNPSTQDDCPYYTNVTPGAISVDGQASGFGCVYPATVQTVAGQLTAARRSWRGYMETMPKPCDHPAMFGQPAPETAKMRYAPRHDPFVYFHSIIDHAAYCDSHVINLKALPKALRHIATTPNFSFITPDVCDDGHDSPCKDGRPGGLRSADKFLRSWVPKITRSGAFRRDGLLVILFDEAGTSDSSACCGEQDANSPSPGIDGPGGGRVGAVLLSPFIRAGSKDTTPYNHYSLLRTVEDIFGLSHLGYAASPGLKPLKAAVG